MAQHQTRARSRLSGFQRASARPEMTLLRAHNLEWIMSILAEHLAHGPVEVARFHEIVDLEIQDMRASSAGLQETARTGREYCNEWVSRQWVNRALVDRVEQYSLTASTLDVLTFTDRLVDHRSTASESRLKQILDAVSRLSGEADPDPRARIDRIDAQVAALQTQRTALLDGDVAVPAGGNAAVPAGGNAAVPASSALHEQLNNIMDLSRHLPADFKRVSDSVYEMHRRFVGDAQEGPVNRGEALRAFFAEHDLLETSDEGKAFRGLMRLWGNHRAQTALRQDIESLLSQDFASELTAEQRRSLRALPRMLVDCAEEVQETYRRLTQSLERYVQSQHSSDRDLRSRLGRAQSAAHALFGQHTASRVDVQIGATMARVRSISQLQLIDPRLHEHPAALDPDPLPLGDALTPAQLRELGGPALEELRLGVELAMAANPAGRPTLREVWLALSPEVRRPKNVVGLLHIAVEQGAVFIDPVTDRLEALRTDGSRITFTVPAAVFPGRDPGPDESGGGELPAEKSEVHL